MTLFQTNSEIAWPQIITSADGQYFAAENELVLCADDALPAAAISVSLPDKPEDGAVVCVKNVSALAQDITVTVGPTPGSTPPLWGADVFSDGDDEGAGAISLTAPGNAVIFRYQQNTDNPISGGIWHIL